MTHLGTEQKFVTVRLSAKDAASLKKLARSHEQSVSEVIRLLIRRGRIARAKL
jgi:hypothetical protein